MGNRVQSVIISVFMLLIAAGAIAFGVNMRGLGDQGRADIRELKEHGAVAVVTDARANISTDSSRGVRGVNRLEVTFTDDKSVSHTLQTLMPPNLDQYQTITGPNGWDADFPGKHTVVGKNVRYLLGAEPRVQLESELAHANTTDWEFVDYLGTGMWVMGAIVGLGATIVVVRSLTRTRGGRQ